ncbi:DUF2867 domain-containing protein [Pararhizobium antarcticum]|uniref:DUF2867 domain-containing protein n=1 Tax=Pararhizobium antarcticum TaxID=1798805 RepID=A0A657LMG1_9HYPH|nr:DUF2867 domain-containing protein [Pararhizobium antarcticum]OJF91888.1 hypothetical protein AX760_22850 [Pararhizobium antarcticum]OJF97966.1 hypothetical protein AX761_13270 [Rhizobium sp. 58]
MKPHRVSAFLPDDRLPHADWADRYEIEVAGSTLTPIASAGLVLGHAPAWVRRLLALRNAIVSRLGLKSAEMSLGDRNALGGFPVLSESAHEAVLGLDDSHLDFRLVVDVRSNASSGQTVGVTTLVFRKNLFGHVYIATITPFHRIIVRTLLAGLARRPA